MTSIAVLGGGAFGAALAIALGREGRAVTLWMRTPGTVVDRQVPRLPGHRLPDSVTVTAARPDAEITLIALPVQQLRQALPPLAPRGAAVACFKGMEQATGLGPTALLAELCPDATPALLTGPSFAADIARGLPTALTLAAHDAATAQALQAALATPRLRLYASDDPIGAEIGGALKNVVAIACGACIGAGLGDSARAALMTRGLSEMRLMAEARGGRAETLAGLSGIGDLALTCHSEQSRNFRYGLALGLGEPFAEDTTVEGAATAIAAATAARALALDLPVIAATAALVTGALSVQDALDALLSRPLKME
jgi:glycerol-3-phosphate dehydrogenase (NAD(P)+)